MAWYDCAVFYHIYPLGMLGGGQKLPALEAVLPHLCELGVNALYLGPIFMSSTHGYDTTDYFHVDARLGTDDDFAPRRTRFLGIQRGSSRWRKVDRMALVCRFDK